MNYTKSICLLFTGVATYSVATTMVGPFLLIYARSILGIPVTTATLLLSIQALAGILVGPFAGVFVDRFGCKLAMLICLAGTATGVALIASARHLVEWACLLGFLGIVSPFFRIGADVFVAMAVARQNRASAYALIRMAYNLGACIGPTLGAVALTISYSTAFYGAAISLIAVTILLAIFFPRNVETDLYVRGGEQSAGFRQLLHDRPLMHMSMVYSLTCIAYVMMFSFLPLYMKEGLGLNEFHIAIVLATNATLIVLMQYAVTRATRRASNISLLVIGACCAAVGLVCIARSLGWQSLVVGMAVMTLGEMLLVPTATVLIASLAPPELKGRYMSVYALTGGVGSCAGPLIGGILTDVFGTAVCWGAGTALCLTAAVGFIVLRSRQCIPSQGRY